MKSILLAAALFLCSFTAQAAQEIPLANVKQVFSDLIAIPNLFDVMAKIESRLTTRLDGKIFKHGRFIDANGWKWRYCVIVPAGNEMDFLTVLHDLITNTAGHYTVVANGTFFITNIAPPMEQEAIDWCTG